MTRQIRLKVNGDYHTLEVQPWDTLIEVLRSNLKVMKTKEYEEFMKKFDVVSFYKNGAETKAFLVDYVKALEEDLKYMDANK